MLNYIRINNSLALYITYNTIITLQSFINQFKLATYNKLNNLTICAKLIPN